MMVRIPMKWRYMSGRTDFVLWFSRARGSRRRASLGVHEGLDGRGRDVCGVLFLNPAVLLFGLDGVHSGSTGAHPSGEAGGSPLPPLGGRE